MVIIVISVMGGFLEMMRHAASHKLTGDVSIQLPNDLDGFSDYEEMLNGHMRSACPMSRLPPL